MTAEAEKTLGSIASFEKSELNYTIRYQTGEYAMLTILNNHVFRYYMAPTGKFLEYPKPKTNHVPSAKINIKAVEEYGREAFDKSVLEHNEIHYKVDTESLKILFDKLGGTLSVYDKRTNQEVVKEHEPIHYTDSSSKQTLHQSSDECFFGGGVQHGKYSHKGKTLLIDTTVCWMIACPKPFYWSTKGYGILRNTWQMGKYDFGTKDPRIIETEHAEDYFDAYYFINPLPKNILNDYYELTGKPVLMPEYALYEGHIDTYNVNYWYVDGPDHRTIHCDDDQYYKAYQLSTIHGRRGILGSLNGKNTRYEFSARFMIDWYKDHDMPLGWLIPNNESGYGQTDSFIGDLENLKNFVKYAKENGVEVALWAETDFLPAELGNPNKGERYLDEELKVGIVALKCYKDNCNDCYDLNVIEKATNIFADTCKNQVRPFLIAVEGWAGVQRCAGICTVAMTGGFWEYIRSHIPTFIGAGLSGLPVVGSDMDGAFGGGDIEVTIRDFQWKTFTPLQLNTEGWGRVFKMPFDNCIELIKINQASLKLKSMLQPYNYTICYESTQGLPMIRAMFLEFPAEFSSYTKESQYQFMWGPSILVAPVFANADVHCRPQYYRPYYWGTDSFVYPKPKYENIPVRNGVYLPDAEQIWIDLLTGHRYQGGKIYNNIKTPLWKIPVFVKNGAIIPLVNANNNPSEIKRDARIYSVYPNGNTYFTVYEDDGKSSEYLEQKFAETTIYVNSSRSDANGNVSIHIHATKGSYKSIVKERTTVLQIFASKNVEKVQAIVNGKTVNISKVNALADFENNDNVMYFDEKFIVNPYLEVFGTDELHQKVLRIKIEKVDVTISEIKLEIEGFANEGDVFGSNSTVIDSKSPPANFNQNYNHISATSIALKWEDNKANYYEIERDSNTIFSNILEDNITFKNINFGTKHSFRIRSVFDAGNSQWSSPIVVKTIEDPSNDTVKDVSVSCSVPCEYLCEVSNLTSADTICIWHTDRDYNGTWFLGDDTPMEKITLTFDLNDVHEIRKIEYVPREDAGNGTLLKIQYRHSIDAENWTDLSPFISWDCDDSTKVIDMGGAKFKHFELDIHDAVLGFGSGRKILFYKMCLVSNMLA